MASIAHVPDRLDSYPTPVLELPLDVGPPMSDRRFMPRVARPFVVRPLDGSEPMEGIDLSFGGLMCASDQPLWPGNTMDMDLLLTGEAQPIPVRARVVEIVSYRGQIAMRMRFEQLTSHRRKRIAMWMGRMAQERDAG